MFENLTTNIYKTERGEGCGVYTFIAPAHLDFNWTNVYCFA